ncbi:hypothetical protein COJ85_30775 [Bacillus sp. AFS076308]|uniref:WbqC family protein n=1 Tax=unclassified Bacillus (in: firmicutes) TaxID=185979 RepID=UPI000BF4EE8A|nr:MULTISPECIES: WbqC family protein [unclassified Bacillus (in: firmicutes)]PFN79487.1 hypothetical protein COJ85_30775 [Bacillus sp. AFS076308]PGV49876.1 hypothetical protein COD92_20045 [Bacillus sp. AFS037270]
MIIAIHQPNYLPWCGYFHKMLSCDLFVILDDVPFSKTAITHRNKIKSPDGPRLLTIPLAHKNGLINEVTISSDSKWAQNHWTTIQRNYARAPFWKEFKDLFLPIYENPDEKLALFNLRIIEVMRTILEINTPIILSSEIPDSTGHKGEKIINLCKSLHATIYLSGTGAKVYNDEKEFERNQISLVYQKFDHPQYTQLWGDFSPNLSAIDLLFNCGPKSKELIQKQVIHE